MRVWEVIQNGDQDGCHLRFYTEFGIIKKRKKIFFSEENTQVINNTFGWLQAPSNYQECQIAILYHIYIDRPTFYVISLTKSGSNCLVAEVLCCKTKMIRYSFTGDFARTRRHMWAEFMLVLDPAPRVFLQVLRFSSLSKNRHAAYSSWLLAVLQGHAWIV